MSAVDVVVRAGDTLGEGVTWSAREGRILWTDIHGRRFHRLDPESGRHETFALEERLACFAPLGAGRLLGGFASGLKLFDVETGATRLLHAIEPELPTTRVNDGRLDREGRLVFGTMDEAPGGAAPLGTIRVFDGRSAPRALVPGIRISNAISFSPDGRTFYFADTPSGEIRTCGYDADGHLTGEPTLFAKAGGGGFPDGATVDAEGCLWNAEWGSGRVVRYTPAGKVDRIYEVPARYVTCCVFGGARLDTLFITSARGDLDAAALAQEPEAGSLFALSPGVRGLADAAFAGPSLSF